jgi:(heptosyl)LPS beta-1,4-glucosyltransferase
VDEILVMDLESTDGSAEVAKQYGARVISRQVLPIVEPLRNEVASRACSEWILALDPDERVTPGLADELRRLAKRCDLDAIVIPRMNIDFGYPPSHPIQRYEPQIRMYRRDRVVWPSFPNKLPEIDEDRLHRLPQKDDVVLIHNRNRSIPEALERAIRYAPAQAQSMIERGDTFTASAMVRTLCQKFHKQFLAGRACQDGVPGALRATILVLFHFYVWAAFWQLSGARRTPEDDRLLRRIGLLFDGAQWLLKILGVLYRFTLRPLRRKRQEIKEST